MKARTRRPSDLISCIWDLFGRHGAAPGRPCGILSGGWFLKGFGDGGLAGQLAEGTESGYGKCRFPAAHLTSFWLTIGHPGHQLEDIRTSGQDWRTGMTFDMTASPPRSLVAPKGAGG